MSHDTGNYLKAQSFVQKIARCGVSSDVGVEGLGDTADVGKDFQVGVVSLIGDGRKAVVVFFGYGDGILEKNRYKADSCLQSLIVYVDIAIFIPLKVGWLECSHVAVRQSRVALEKEQVSDSLQPF